MNQVGRGLRGRCGRSSVTEEDEAIVAQYGWLEKVSDRVRGGEMCVFHSVHVDASVDVVVVLKWASGDACGARGVGVSILRSEDDGVVAGIGCTEGPKLPTMTMTPGRLVAD